MSQGLGVALDLLQQGLSASHPVQVTPGLAWSDDKQSFVDGQGNPTAPLQKPTWWDRFSNPQGSSAADNYNNQQTLAPVIAKQQEAIQKSIAEERMRPALQGFFGNKIPANGMGTVSDIMYGSGMNTFNPDKAMDLGRRYNNYQNGIIPLQSKSDIATAGNSARYQGARGNLGVPETEAGFESTTGNLGIGRGNIQIGGLDDEATNYRLWQKNSGMTAYGKSQTIPHENAVNLSEAIANERNIPLTSGAGGATDLAAMNQYMIQRFGVAPRELTQHPYLAETTTQGVKLPTGLSPYFKPNQFATMQYLANGGIMGGKGQPPMASLPNGEALPMKSNIIRPTVGQLPPDNTAAPAPSNQGQSSEEQNIRKPMNTFTLGESAGGSDIDNTPTQHYGATTKKEALEQLGFTIDKNGQLQLPNNYYYQNKVKNDPHVQARVRAILNSSIPLQ